MPNDRYQIKNNRKNRCIIICIIILIKLLLMGLFSSDYQNMMFIPFVKNFLAGENPYTYYYNNQLLASFPYFPLMLLVESLGGGLLQILAPNSYFLTNLIFKLPLLIFDMLGYYFIRKMNIRFKYAAVFYFGSPIILYATYMHGQLDIIPTSLFIAALYFLLNCKNQHNLIFYALFLGFALSTKLHILAALPILFLYVINKRGYAAAIKYHFITFFTVFVVTVGFFGKGFVETALFNKEQSILLTVNFDYGATQILIPVLMLMLIYLNVFEMNYFNKNLVISMLGLLFAIFLICIPPMPAWFVWIVPFITFYFGIVKKDKYKVMFVYFIFNFIYLIYFSFFHQTEYVDIYFLGKALQNFKISDASAKNVFFTLMIACFAIVIYKIYHFGIASNSLYQRRNIPFAIGIAGDSGVGKSSMLGKIEQLFGSDKDVLFIEGDGDHRWRRGDKNWENYTALDPRANYLYRQAKDIHILKAGNHVDRTEYDHDLGIFTELKRVKPKKYIVLCGLHALYLPQLRQELDLKIFIDTDSELRKFWKIQRDTSERGYSKDQIVAQIEKRLPDAEKYIYPQKEFADMVIIYFDKNLKNCFQENHTVTLSVKLSLNITLDLEYILLCFRECGINPEFSLSNDFMHQEIIFDGKELAEKKVDFAEIAERNILQYEDFFIYSPKWGTGVDGVIQLFLLLIISNKMGDIHD